MKVVCRLQADSRTVKAQVTLSIFEGSSCGNDDKDAEKSFEVTLAAEQTSQVDNRVTSTGIGGGDYLQVYLTFTNGLQGVHP